jgi:diguanylate cyclase (GGDEF)-like protein
VATTVIKTTAPDTDIDTGTSPARRTRETRHGSHRKHQRRSGRAERAWLLFLVTGLASAALVQLLPPGTWAAAYVAVQLVAMAAMAVGLLFRRPAVRSAWVLLVVGAVVWSIASGYGLFLALAAGRTPSVWWAGAPWTVGVLVATGVLSLVGLATVAWRSGRLPAGASIDIMIICAAVAVGGWAIGLRPYARSAGLDPYRLTVVFGFGVLGAVLLTAALALVLVRRPQASHLLLGAAAGANVVGNVVSAVGPATRYSGLAVLCWQAGALFLGAAVLHPSAARQGGHGPVPDCGLSSTRLSMIAVLAAGIPAAPVLADSITGSPAPRTSAGTLAILAVAAVALVAVRLGFVAATASRATTALDTSTGERAALEEHLHRQASHDPLTGLVNRPTLTQRLDLLARNAEPVALLLLDLDGLRDINDSVGYPAGDQLLVQVADRLRTALPEVEVLARLGGDEFAALWRGRAAADAQPAVDAVLTALRRPYRIGRRELHLTTSGGLVQLHDQRSAAEVLRDADLALCAAKAAGGGRSASFRPQLRAVWVRRNELAHGLRHALDANEMSLLYQPVVDLATGRMVAAEALLRWHPTNAHPVPPVQFIPVAEETGLIVPLGWWAMRQACADAKAWHEAGGIAVTVNISGYQLREPLFVDTVLAILSETGLPAPALILELTESTLITDPDASTAALQRLRERGVRVAIDDFGTGYSSLSYLIQLPVDIIKIDRSFTTPRGAAARHPWAFTKAILELARSLRLPAIAEGVESAEQAMALRALHCPMAQGYLYSPPVSASALAALVNRSTAAAGAGPDRSW